MRLQQTVHKESTDSIETAISAFMLHQRASSHSEHTVKHYRTTLNHFRAFLAESGTSNLQNVDATQLRQFIAHLQTRFRPKTVHGVVTDIKAFLNFLAEEGLITVNPFRRVAMPKLPKTILPAFENEDIKNLLAATVGKDQLSIRNRAMILVLLDSGVRLSELASIRVGDINAETGTFKVMGKGSKERICRISPVTLKALSKYLAFRRGKAEEPLWCGTRGYLTRFGVAQVIESIGKQAKVHAHPHKFRRTCALMMLRNGADIFSVQYLLGHSDLTVLRRYLAQTETDYLTGHAKFGPLTGLQITTKAGQCTASDRLGSRST
jgi:site-specific recombinase XerD